MVATPRLGGFSATGCCGSYGPMSCSIRGLLGPGGASAGPLVAIRLHVLTRKTLGGLETDLDGRVLRPDGSPLSGVYAVGRWPGSVAEAFTATGLSKEASLGGCLFTGRIVGRALAASL